MSRIGKKPVDIPTGVEVRLLDSNMTVKGPKGELSWSFPVGTSVSFLAAHRKIASTGKAACIGCHDPHRSPGRRLLRAGLHEPVKAGTCEKCHRSDGKLLLPVGRGLCLVCHKKAAFAGPVAHEPVKKSLCLDCHDPHGSGSVRLLRGGYSLEREVRAVGKEYALCLTCHERGRLLGGVGEGATRFVAGARNLHALHVLPQQKKSSERAAGEKALTCATATRPTAR